MTRLPEKRRSRRRWITSAAAVVVAVVAAITIVLTLTGGSSSGTERYGQRAVDVIRALHVCDQPEPNEQQPRPSCKFEEGGGAVVTTTTDETEQSFLVAMIKDQDSPNSCHRGGQRLRGRRTDRGLSDAGDRHSRGIRLQT